MTTDDLYQFIASHYLAVLGTTSPADTPECALIGIARHRVFRRAAKVDPLQRL